MVWLYGLVGFLGEVMPRHGANSPESKRSTAPMRRASANRHASAHSEAKPKRLGALGGQTETLRRTRSTERI